MSALRRYGYVDRPLFNPTLEELKRGSSLLDKVTSLPCNELMQVIFGSVAYNEVIRLPLGNHLEHLVKGFKRTHANINVKSFTGNFPQYIPQIPFSSLFIPCGGMETFLFTSFKTLPDWMSPPKGQKAKVVNFLAQRVTSWREGEKLLPPKTEFSNEPFGFESLKRMESNLKLNVSLQAPRELLHTMATHMMDFTVLYMLHTLRTLVKIGISPEGIARFYDMNTYNAAKAAGQVSSTTGGMESSMDESMDEQSSSKKNSKRQRETSQSENASAKESATPAPGKAEDEKTVKKRAKKRARKESEADSDASKAGTSNSGPVEEEILEVQPKRKKPVAPIELDSESESDTAKKDQKIAFDLKKVKKEKGHDYNPLKVKKEKLEYDPIRVKVEKGLSSQSSASAAPEKPEPEANPMLSYLFRILAPPTASPSCAAETETSSVVSNDNGSSTSGNGNVGDAMKRAKLKQVADQLFLDVTSDPSIRKDTRKYSDMRRAQQMMAGGRRRATNLLLAAYQPPRHQQMYRLASSQSSSSAAHDEPTTATGSEAVSPTSAAPTAAIHRPPHYRKAHRHHTAKHMLQDEFPNAGDVSGAGVRLFDYYKTAEMVNALPTIQEKIDFVSPFERPWTQAEKTWRRDWHPSLMATRKAWSVPSTPAYFDCLQYYQYITKTRLVESPLDQYYQGLVPPTEKFEAAMTEYLLSMMEQHRQSGAEEGKFDEKAVSALLASLFDEAMQALAHNMPRLADFRVAYDVQSESFWIRSGFMFLYDQTDPGQNDVYRKLNSTQKFIGDDRRKLGELAFVSRDRLAAQLRSKEAPAPLFAHESQQASLPVFDEAVNVAEDILFSPKVMNMWPDEQPLWQCPGYFVESDETHKFGRVAGKSLLDLNDRMELWGLGDAADPAERRKVWTECAKAQAVSSLFTTLNAQAHTHGFTQYTDVDRPFSSQLVLSNGRSFVFAVGQLNTCAINIECDGFVNDKSNFVHVEEPMNLFEYVKDGVFYHLPQEEVSKIVDSAEKGESKEPKLSKGLNPRVLERVLQMMMRQ